jgi:hypothetical protein
MHLPDGGCVEVTGTRSGGRRSLEIRAERPPVNAERGSADRKGAAPPSAGLRIIFARLLLEVQGATLACGEGNDGAWAALIEFPARCQD